VIWAAILGPGAGLSGGMVLGIGGAAGAYGGAAWFDRFAE